MCAVVTLSSAQNIQYGPKVGVSMSTITIDNLDGVSIDKDMRTALQFGGFIKYQLSPAFALQGEVLYSLQGAKLKWAESDVNYEGKMRLNYITIPILAKFYMYDGLFVEAGPQVAFLVKDTLEGDLSQFADDLNYKTADFDVVMGLGYEFEMGLMVGARYNLGVIDVVKDVDGKTVDSKNGVIQLYAGWAF